MRLFIFPAQWLYGLFRALPGDEFSCHRHQRIEICLSPAGPTRLRWLDISHGCQNHTTSPYAAPSPPLRPARCRSNSGEGLETPSSAQRWITHGRTRPETTIAPDAAASTASNPASVTIAIRPSCRGGRPKDSDDLPEGGSGMFFAMGLDGEHFFFFFAIVV